MIVRIAEAAGLELVDVDVELTGLARIAEEISLIGSNPIGRISPLELLKRHNGHNRRIELDGMAAGCEAHNGGCDAASEIPQRMLCVHLFLPYRPSFLTRRFLMFRPLRP